jgi:hypothetical protein
MTRRTDFTLIEWQIVCQAPTYAGLLISTAQRGGFSWEALTIARMFKEARAEHPEGRLLDDIVADRPRVERVRFRSPDEARAYSLERIGNAIDVVRQKGQPADVDAFASFVLDVAENVARAHPETGEHVSHAEKNALAEIRAAAGLDQRDRSACQRGANRRAMRFRVKMP